MSRKFWVIFGLILGATIIVSLVLRNGSSVGGSATPSATPRASQSGTPRATATPVPSATVTPAPTYVPTPTPTLPPAVNISGAGGGSSRAFGLTGGYRYQVRYVLRSSCQYYAELHSTDGSYHNTDFIQDTGPSSGSYGLTGFSTGSYYVAMSTGGGCSWSMTFVPS